MKTASIVIVLNIVFMDGWVLRPFNSISVISRRWKGEHERLCAMKRRLGLGRISPPAGFEPMTLWSYCLSMHYDLVHYDLVPTTYISRFSDGCDFTSTPSILKQL